jgi:hypothetical protein
MISDDEPISEVLKDEPGLLGAIRSILGENFGDTLTLDDVHKQIRRMQCTPEAPTNLTDLAHSLHIMARRRDDKLLAGMFKQMAESVNKTAQQVDKTAQQVDKTAQQVDKTTENLNKECRERKELNNWQKAMVDDMEDAVTGAIKDKLNDAVTYDVLRKMPTVKKKGDIYVEWDGIVFGNLGEKNVLVLVEAKNNMRLCLLDEEERDNVIKKADEKEKRKLEENFIPGKLERFIDAFENLEKWYNASDSSVAKREAQACLGLIQRLKSEGITKKNFMVAVAGNYIPTEVVGKIKQLGYWRITRKDGEYEVFLPSQ